MDGHDLTRHWQLHLQDLFFFFFCMAKNGPLSLGIVTKQVLSTGEYLNPSKPDNSSGHV